MAVLVLSLRGRRPLAEQGSEGARGRADRGRPRGAGSDRVAGRVRFSELLEDFQDRRLYLAEHPEPGQTFAQYVRGKPNRPDDKRGTIEFRTKVAGVLACRATRLAWQRAEKKR